MAISLENATIVSLFVQCILYGMFSILLVAATMILMKRRAENPNISKCIVAGAPLMFILATIHLVADLARFIVAFTGNATGPFEVLISSSSAFFLVKATVFVAQMLLGDSFMVYRMHMAWGGDKRVVIPVFIALLGSIGASIVLLHACSTKDHDASLFVLQKPSYACFAMTLAVNLLSTSLIALRIMYTVRLTRHIDVQGRRPIFAAVIIIESGVLYSLALTLLFVLYALGNYGQFVIADGIIPLIGIVFTMITIRVGLGLSKFGHELQKPSDRHSPRIAVSPSLLRSTSNISQPAPIVAVTVSKVTHTDINDLEAGMPRVSFVSRASDMDSCHSEQSLFSSCRVE